MLGLWMNLGLARLWTSPILPRTISKQCYAGPCPSRYKDSLKANAPGQVDIFGRPYEVKGKGSHDLRQRNRFSLSSHAIQTAAGG